MTRCMLLLLVIAALVAAAILAGQARVETRTAGTASSAAAGTATETVSLTVTVTETVTVTHTATPAARPLDRFIADREYYAAAARLIESARRCICIAMYIMKYDPGDRDDPVNNLLQLLAAKARQGVKVYVLLDDETARDYPETIAFLRSAGINVRLDESPRRRMHAKLLIVDNETVLAGSHNWSESAMKYNHEASIETSDPAVAAEAARYFSQLWERGRPAG